MPPIDLRSDTVTRPTAEMRRAMAAAEVGDDVFGDDPTVNKLQEIAARTLGKEAALFVPTGSMGNQVAIKVWTKPGDELWAEETSHIFLYELGAFAVVSGCIARPFAARHGILRAAALREAVKPRRYYLTAPGLLEAETTHNSAGGTVYPLAVLEELHAFAQEMGIPFHLDGARIFNAATVLGCDVKAIARHADSVMFCLSKGLCAPVGSILAGSADFIEKARRVRKLFGGGMRQAGVLAAAGLIAIEDMPRRLGEDHENARRIAEVLSESPKIQIDLGTVQTNIVIFSLAPGGRPASEVVESLKGRGILCAPLDARRIRMVTHRDVSAADCRKAAEETLRILAG